MAKPVNVLKPSFSGGEFAPSLWSRVDLQKYYSGCRTLRNFFVHPHGGISNRPGLRHIAETKDPTKLSRLMPFEFTTEQAYQIEFGEYYCRFYMNRGQIIAPTTTAAWITATVYYIGDFVKVSDIIYRSKTNHTSNGTTHNTPPANTTDWEVSSIYEIVTPYAEDDLVDLQISQSADTLYITHPDFQQRTLTRYGHTSWRIALYAFEDGPFMPQNVDESMTLAVSAVSGTGKTLTCTEDLFFSTHVGALFKLIHEIAGSTVTSAFTGTGQSTSIKCFSTWRLITHGTWTGKVKIEKSIDGGSTWTELRLFSSVNDNNINTYGTEPEDQPFLIRLNCSAYTSGTINADLSSDPFTQTGVVKVIAYTSTTVVTVDVMTECGDTAATMDWAEGSWSDYRGYPKTSAFYQDRFGFACTRSEPQTSWLSKTSNYINFGRSDPLVSSDGVSVRLPSRKGYSIQNLVPLDDIIAFTSSSEWRIGPGAENVMAPDSVSQKFQGSRGCNGVTPIVIGTRVIYIQPKGSVVRDLAYDYASDKYDGDPLSLLSQHLFQGHQIIDMAYQQEPDSLLWCVREDGMLLSLTYLREQEIVAWAWHDTDGQVESISVIPGDTYDEVWMIVKRGTKRFVELLTQRMESTDPRKQFFVDSGISYDSPVVITGATAASPVVITAADHGFSDGDLVDILDVEGMTEINELRFKVANKTDDTFELTDPDDDTDIDGSEFEAYVSGGEVRKAITVLTGLEHLEGVEVVILADGNVITGETVASGQITLDVPASIAHVGRGYISDLETLNIEISDASGTTQGKLVKVSQVTLMFLNSRGGWIGPNSTKLDEIVQRTSEPMGSPIDLITGSHKQAIAGNYEIGGRIFFRQTDPLPVTILAAIPVCTVGG